MAFLVRRGRIEVILPISKYALLQDMLYHRQTSIRLNDHKKMSVISTAPCLTDKGELTAFYKIDEIVYIKENV